jgi:hypothetical protein
MKTWGNLDEWLFDNNSNTDLNLMALWVNMTG